LKFFEIFKILKRWILKKKFNFRILKFFENFEILWKFLNAMKIFNYWDDEVRVFRINIKLSSNPVAELKIRENDSHCRSIVLKTTDRSTVKQLEKAKNSNFNVENFVVMFIYWGTINAFISGWKGIFWL
jgi:hypothetical protein